MIRAAAERAALAAACVLMIAGCGPRDSQTADKPAAPANVAVAAAAAGPSFPPPRPLVPFVKVKDMDCNWNMHAKGKEKWVRGDISRGDENPMISFVDHIFSDWSDSEDHKIEISVGDPKRRLAVNAWSSNAGGQTPGSAAFYMDAKLRQLIGGATSLQIWKGGKPVFNTLLSGTPSAAELDKCIQKPGWDVDSEYDSELE